MVTHDSGSVSVTFRYFQKKNQDETPESNVFMKLTESSFPNFGVIKGIFFLPRNIFINFENLIGIFWCLLKKMGAFLESITTNFH